MDASDRGEGDDRTFRVSFTGDGAARLRERVKEKLSEFMGDYTDDTLVEYVVVLLRNGRHKDEARKELHVFLGDDSFSFISWLWDHLSSNLHLYVQPGEPLPDEVAQRKPKLHELSGRRSSQTEHSSGNVQNDSEYEREKSAKIFRSRRNREWKGLVQEPELFPLQSTVTENVHSEEKTRRRASIVRRSPSPRPWLDRKRGKGDEQPPKNSQQRDTASLPVVDAPRRLLQFAVRDAVRTVQQPSSRAEPGLKRLRSVVSASTADNVENERPKRTRSVSKVPTAVSTAIKAAAEAAEDVSKVRYSGNVFDRLGHGMGATETVNQSLDCRAPVMEDEEDEHFDQMAGSDQINYCQRNEYEGELTGNMTMLGRDAVMAIDSASDNDGYDSVDIVRHRGFDSSETATSANKDKNSLMVQYSVAQDVDKGVRKTRTIGQNPPDSGAAKSSSKIVNISVNVNTWKPPHYQESRDVALVENRMAVDKNEGTAGKSHVILKESNTPMPEKEKEITRAGIQKDSQKTMVSAPGSYATGRPSEDVDSRTIFVSNVHFAATKDTLSRHFNKFGEVLKVVIVTDAATGQPTGSAYVEFLRKESAELALSLNGTSFMSRILKVVRSSAHHEATALMGWPRIARAAPFASRLGRVPYPRGMLASAFRARLPIKTGARSLQWKREAAATQTSNGAKGIQNAPVSSGNSVISSTGRNLTYIRTESKAD